MSFPGRTTHQLERHQEAIDALGRGHYMPLLQMRPFGVSCVCSQKLSVPPCPPMGVSAVRRARRRLRRSRTHTRVLAEGDFVPDRGWTGDVHGCVVGTGFVLGVVPPRTTLTSQATTWESSPAFAISPALSLKCGRLALLSPSDPLRRGRSGPRKRGPAAQSIDPAPADGLVVD